MTQEKTRLKFRVSASEPSWTEKWGVGLFPNEEFHVTDQLLKLPFQERAPKTVCIFSLVDGVLAFRLADEDRQAQVNGAERKDALVTSGDRIKIGDTLTIEIALAPPKVKARAAEAGPALGGMAEIPQLDPEDGPTLTFAPTGTTETRLTAPSGPSVRERVRERIREKERAVEESARSPVFEEISKSLEIQEPSFNPGRPSPDAVERAKFGISKTRSPDRRPNGPMPGYVQDDKVELHGMLPSAAAKKRESSNPRPIPKRPASLSSTGGALPTSIPPRPISISSGPMPGYVQDAKVELDDVPHVTKDRSLDDRMAEIAGESIRPLYAKEADLGTRPTFGERILSAISRILKRDELDPVEDPFAEDGPDTRPWLPEGIADPGISEMRTAVYGSSGEKHREKTPKYSAIPPKPWIPEAISAAARIRGRALVFLVAAIGTLMIAVGVFRIQYRVAVLQESIKPLPPDEHTALAPSRGLPIEILEDKVRRMRPPPSPMRRR